MIKNIHKYSFLYCLNLILDKISFVIVILVYNVRSSIVNRVFLVIRVAIYQFFWFRLTVRHLMATELLIYKCSVC